MVASNTSTGSGAVAADSPAGIHCANPDCRTRAGERSRGHQSCRALLCGHCCQNAAREAAEAGEQRPVCKVHARRVHTGHKPVPRDLHADGSLAPSQPQSQFVVKYKVDAVESPGSGTAEPEELHDLLEKRARLEQSLKRSLTMVIWFRNGIEPLRIALEVTTFPLFQLQDFPELVRELGLQSSSYVDSYIAETGQWEQHKISTVRSVGRVQRLLYRLRPSLLDSLADCPSLEQELSLQPAPTALMAKRQAEPLSSSPAGKQARILSNPNPVRPPTAPVPQSSSLQNWQNSSGDISNSPGAGTSSWSPAAATGAIVPGIRASPGTPVLSIGLASAKNANSDSYLTGAGRRWPTDYSVHEIREGFDAMVAIVKADPGARQKTAFEQVFPPCRYVKSTVGRAKLYWKRANEEIRNHFLTLNRDDPQARWTNFVHLMDGRLVIEVGKEKLGGVVEADETADDEEMVDPNPNTNNNALSFAQPVHAQGNQPQINIQSPPNAGLTAHATLPMTRAPSAHMNTLLPQTGPLTHHASAPAMQMAQSFTLDRNISMNRSSSSLSGAISVPEV